MVFVDDNEERLSITVSIPLSEIRKFCDSVIESIRPDHSNIDWDENVEIIVEAQAFKDTNKSDESGWIIMSHTNNYSLSDINIDYEILELGSASRHQRQMENNGESPE